MATVSALEDRNRELIEEISKLRNEMDVTVNEYTSAFKNRQDSGQEGTTEESGTPDSGGEAEIPDSSGEAMSGPGAPS
ncbi:MAG: hypothetical protein GWO23_15390, partial [Gammaproteobacteria bacterium]|nr:hypothetical protein [Gammaproteobacteria bacterium]NIW44604.1 hypothetical protein [Gammaproteobacteria bacterium]